MKVLSYSHAYVGGGHQAGGETTLHDLMRLLNLEPSFETTALVSKPAKNGRDESYVVDGVEVLPYQTDMDPMLLFPEYDVIVAHLECALRGGMIARRTTPAVFGHLIHNDQNYCIKAAERGASFLIYNTEWVERAYQHIGLPSVTFHPPVDPTRYVVDNAGAEYITLINLSEGGPSAYDKGPKTFYEMARRFPNEKFLGVKGAYGNQLIEDLPNVTIMEHLTDVRAALEKTKILLVPSLYESYGRAPIEAACSGIPSVVTDTEGLREAMGWSAMYCPFEAFDAWEGAIQDTLTHYEQCQNRALERAAFCHERTRKEWPDVVRLFELAHEERWLVKP